MTFHPLTPPVERIRKLLQHECERIQSSEAIPAHEKDDVLAKVEFMVDNMVWPVYEQVERKLNEFHAALAV